MTSKNRLNFARRVVLGVALQLSLLSSPPGVFAEWEYDSFSDSWYSESSGSYFYNTPATFTGSGLGIGEFRYFQEAFDLAYAADSAGFSELFSAWGGGYSDPSPHTATTLDAVALGDEASGLARGWQETLTNFFMSICIAVVMFGIVWWLKARFG